MRELVLRLIIKHTDESHVVGTISQEYLKRKKDGEYFNLSDGKIDLRIRFEDESEKILSAICELPDSCFEKMEIIEIKEEAVLEASDHEENVVDGEEPSGALDSDKKDADVAEEASKEEFVIDCTRPSKPLDAGKTVGTEHGTTEPTWKKKKSNKVPGKMDEIGKRVFSETAAKSESFEDFVEKLGEFIGISNHYKVFFRSLLKAAASVSAISMKEIARTMDGCEEPYNDSKKVAISQHVTKAFSAIGSEVKLFNFLCEVVKYKDYDFSVNSELEEAKNATSEQTNSEQAAPEQETAEQESSEETAEQESSEETETKQAVSEQETVEFKVFSKEIIEMMSKNMNLHLRVGELLDRIRSKQDHDSYDAMRRDLINVIIGTAKGVKEKRSVKSSLKDIATKFFGDKDYIAVSFILQSIKNYCESNGNAGDTMYQFFFEDLSRFV